MVKALAESEGENPGNAAVNNSRKSGGNCSLLGKAIKLISYEYQSGYCYVLKR
jgi:hypothetical protein